MSRNINLKSIFLPILIAILFSFAQPIAEGAASRDKLIKRIHAACEKTTSEFLDNYKAVCECVVRNYKKVDVSIEDLELMTRSHEGDQTAQDKLQDEKYSDLILLDYDITEGCPEDPSYTYKP
ncbi:MAG: hypothetical protein M9962_00265 [Oligoflexia bacterium]|nr:hypothetical protein [Oligoflexia bacterium]